MKIAANHVVSFDYVLRGDDGEEIERGSGEDGMTYLHGHSQIVPGLEAALDGKSTGDQLSVVVPPGEGFGAGDGEEIRVPRSDLPPVDIDVGEPLQGEAPDGSVSTFWVSRFEGDDVVLSTAHPLSGKTLRFDVTVRDVREATEDELAHGHAHGAEHHHHEDSEA